MKKIVRKKRVKNCCTVSNQNYVGVLMLKL